MNLNTFWSDNQNPMMKGLLSHPILGRFKVEKFNHIIYFIFTMWFILSRILHSRAASSARSQSGWREQQAQRRDHHGELDVTASRARLSVLTASSRKPRSTNLAGEEALIISHHQQPGMVRYWIWATEHQKQIEYVGSILQKSNQLSFQQCYSDKNNIIFTRVWEGHIKHL